MPFLLVVLCLVGMLVVAREFFVKGKMRMRNNETAKKTVMVGGCLSIAILIGMIDMRAHAVVSLSLFYLLPVAIAAWKGGQKYGVGIALFCAGIGYYADISTVIGIRHVFIPYWNSLMELGFFIISAVVVGRLREMINKEKDLTLIDSLTELFNRRGFVELATREIRRARRLGLPCTIGFVDVDNFRQINDIYGHTAGDTLMKKVAAILKEQVRDIDIVGRLGGEDFALFLPESGEALSRTVFNRIEEALNAGIDNKKCSVNISTVTFPVMADKGINELLHQVDATMYA